RTVVPNLPIGKTLWLGWSDDGDKAQIFKYHSIRQATLITVDLNLEEAVARSLPLRRTPWRACVAEGVLFVISRKEAELFSLVTGQSLARVDLPSPRFQSVGRYFYQPGTGWVLLTWDGLEARFEPIQLNCSVSETDVWLLFDREGYEGPWVLTKGF